MFYFICKFDILMKFIQNISDVRNRVSGFWNLLIAINLFQLCNLKVSE